MITEGVLKFSDVVDPIKTEETIYNQIKDIDFQIPYVGVPLAYSLNKLGLSKTQNLIDYIEQKYPFKKFYVCQHIQVINLNFYNNVVFTPHVESNQNFEFIPHYNPIFNEKPTVKDISERTFDFSFIGDYNTHSSRYKLSEKKINNSIIKNTNGWFFYKNRGEQNNLKEEYIKILLNSKISLCPRGTGPSTLRLFESMSVGTVPLIFNSLKLPLEISSSIIQYDIEDFLSNDVDINHNLIKQKSEILFEYYWNNLCNNKLSKSIINFFKK